MESFDLTTAGFDTKFIHAGQHRDREWGALATPIYQTSTFCYETVEEGQQKIMREIPGFYYSRSGNPTNAVLEEKIAAIEGAEAAVSTASGLGAIGCVMVALLKTGDHVVCGQCVYGGTSHIMGTMGMRVRRHCANAMEMARYLEASPCVERVYYAGLDSHPQHELAAAQMQESLFTGMIAFELRDGINGLSAYDAGAILLNSLNLAQIAVSLGDPDTLIEHPASMTHARVSREDKEKAGISDGLIRLSVGLENVEDIIRDFERAFALL